MIVSLYTPTVQFANDLADVIRIFLGNIELKINEDGGDVCIRHTETIQGNIRFCRMAATGVFSGIQ